MSGHFGHFITRIFAVVGTLLSVQGASAQETVHPWEGWYGGGVLGISWTDVDVLVAPNKASTGYSGILGGGIVGNNLLVTEEGLFGLEADLVLNDVANGIAIGRHRLALLARGGLFVTPSTLLFGVVGLAGGQYKAKVSTNVTTMTMIFDEEPINITTVTPVTGTREERLWGYTIGAGFEQEGAIGSTPVRWGIEYRYTDFGEWDFNIAGQPFSVEPKVHDLRFRAVFPF